MPFGHSTRQGKNLWGIIILDNLFPLQRCGTAVYFTAFSSVHLIKSVTISNNLCLCLPGAKEGVWHTFRMKVSLYNMILSPNSRSLGNCVTMVTRVTMVTIVTLFQTNWELDLWLQMIRDCWRKTRCELSSPSEVMKTTEEEWNLVT